MAQINLLKTEAGTGNSARNIIGLTVKILTAVLVLMVLVYGYLWLSLRSTNKAIENAETKIAATQTKIINNPSRDELLTRQRQITVANGLINKHVSWSYLLPELARVSLKSASYVSITGENNKISLTVNLPNYAEIDKFLQVFDLPDFNQQLSDVKVVSISEAQNGATTGPRLKLEMKLNPTFISNRFQ